jgi:DNA-binding transcriptional LysR family regulator
VAVAEAGSLTKAAATVFIAQPSLSHQISTLEEELGCKLFERMPRGLQLTTEGRAFLVESRRVLAAVGRAKATVRAVSSGFQGELRLGTVTSLAVRLIPDAAGTWHAKHPNVALHLSEFLHADALEEALAAGDVDLAIGPTPKHDAGSLVSLGLEEFVFVLPSSDPLGGRERIDPADLAERSWVLFAPDHGLTEIVARVCAHAGFTPKVAARTSQVTTASRLAAAGLGPTLIPANAIDTDRDLVIRSAVHPILRELTVYSRSGMSALARSFIEELRASPASPQQLTPSIDVTDAFRL